MGEETLFEKFKYDVKISRVGLGQHLKMPTNEMIRLPQDPF